jgi:hypothetical protein
MSTSKLALANGALRLLGEGPLTQSELTNNAREPARVFNTLWADAVVADCLAAGQWKFAKRTVRMDATPSIAAADFNYKYVFEQPVDLVRLVGMYGDAGMNEPLQTYRDEGGFWLANIESLYLTYISSDAAFGGDLSLWTPGFTEFVKAHIAREMAGPLTSKGQELVKVRKDCLIEAQSTDAMADPTRSLPVGAWVRARNTRLRGVDRP